MKKMLFFLFIILFFSLSLSAQDVDANGNIIKYRQKTIVDFEDVMLEGKIKKPTGSFLMDRAKKKFNSLINLKKDFNKELVKSVDMMK